MNIFIYRVPVFDGVVQREPMTYFQKYTLAGVPFFSKRKRDAARFEDDGDLKAQELVKRLSIAKGWDFLEEADERAA